MWLPRGRRRRGEKEWEFGISRGKLSAVGWRNNKALLYSTGNYFQHPVTNYNTKEYEKACMYVCMYVCMCVYIYIYDNPKLPIHTTFPPPFGINTLVLYICVSYFCFANKFICIIFLFHISDIMIFVFLFMTYFTLQDSL